MSEGSGRPRLVDEVKRGWHVKRPDGTWGLVAHAARQGADVLLMFEDRPVDEVETYPAGQLYQTRTPLEQMHAAMLDREDRAVMIRALYQQRRLWRNQLIQLGAG